ncbi:hypothetical protein BKI52_12550 [marine bacterium AO1-C]|nr:hypothetical protein BKI52_12550 [marine bacterium AO1-C]
MENKKQKTGFDNRADVKSWRALTYLIISPFIWIKKNYRNWIRRIRGKEEDLSRGLPKQK